MVANNKYFIPISNLNDTYFCKAFVKYRSQCYDKSKCPTVDYQCEYDTTVYELIKGSDPRSPKVSKFIKTGSSKKSKRFKRRK